MCTYVYMYHCRVCMIQNLNPASGSLCRRNDLEIFDDNAYSRVFLTRNAALRWWQHNRVLGSPSKAANIQQLLKRSRQKAKQMVKDYNYLGALQVLAVAAGAQLKHQSVVDLSRCGTTPYPGIELVNCELCVLLFVLLLLLAHFVLFWHTC